MSQPDHETPDRIHPPLQGRRVRLRPYEIEDADRLNPLFNDPDVLAGLKVAFPQPTTGFKAWLESIRGREDEIHLAIETLEGELIGGCSLRQVDLRGRTGNLGIWIAQEHWDRGFGTDAVRTVCRFGFRHMNLRRIELTVIAGNARAKRAYEKVGFRQEGTLRDALFLRGAPVDEILMSVLPGELKEEEEGAE